MVEKNKRIVNLSHPYLSIAYRGIYSYGSNQEWSESKVMKGYGCGVIASSDVLAYLGLHKRGCQTKELRDLKFEKGAVEYQSYQEYVKVMRKKYFPVMPHFGIPGCMLPFGFNWYFYKNHIPLRAHWSVLPKNLMSGIQKMLDRDIPVILSIGLNFPFFWGKKALQIYTKSHDGTYTPIQKVRAHYVTVTGVEDDKLCISSWGKEYYIFWEEYRIYVKKHSSYFASNICLIK